MELKLYIAEEEIQKRIKAIAAELSDKLAEKKGPIVFVIVLDGAFRFANDLIHNVRGVGFILRAPA